MVPIRGSVVHPSLKIIHRYFRTSLMGLFLCVSSTTSYLTCCPGEQTPTLMHFDAKSGQISRWALRSRNPSKSSIDSAVLDWCPRTRLCLTNTRLSILVLLSSPVPSTTRRQGHATASPCSCSTQCSSRQSRSISRFTSSPPLHSMQRTGCASKSHSTLVLHALDYHFNAMKQWEPHQAHS